MKTQLHTLLMLLAFGVVATAQPSRLQQQNRVASSNACYQQGLAAEKAGHPDKAREAYLKALQLNPGNAHARYRLGIVKTHHASLAAKGREARLATVVIPEFRVREATLKEALAALRILIEKESSGELMPNFIIQDGGVSSAPVSLVLKSAPASAILQYLLEQAGAKARHDEHAIVILPRR